MKFIRKIFAWISNLKVAISLLLIIAFTSALGTLIPQNEAQDLYREMYSLKPWLGIINGDLILKLGLDHVYSSFWFLTLLYWLCLALIVCSWRRQFPGLKSAYSWTDYKTEKSIKKLSISETIKVEDNSQGFSKIEEYLKNEGWAIKANSNRFSARKGAIGRAGPLLVHLGLILIILGSTLGSLNGQKVEKFIRPSRSMDLLDAKGTNQLTIYLKDFTIQRDSKGRTEQFISKLILKSPLEEKVLQKEISVNHPLRFKGITIYQADWALSSITLQIENQPELELPLRSFPELGDQIWGLVIPIAKENNSSILITLSNEKGPVKIFDDQGESLASLIPGGGAKNIKGINLKVTNISQSSGILLKRDPGVPIVYSGFTITLIGGVLSLISTRQLWVIFEAKENRLHIGGLSNRNLSGLALEIPKIIEITTKN